MVGYERVNEFRFIVLAFERSQEDLFYEGDDKMLYITIYGRI